MEENKKYCKIVAEKDEDDEDITTIYFYEEERGEYLIFGWIDEGIMFNIEKDFNNTMIGTSITEKIPNPPLRFYVELGEKIKKIIKNERE